MTNVTKKQHYVWRNYLVPWTHNQELKTGKIYVFRKNPRGGQAKIEHQILTKIGYEKFFYDISAFSEKDIIVYNKFLEFFQRESNISFALNEEEIKNANEERDFIEKIAMCPAENIDNKYHFREKLMNKNISFYKDSVCREIADLFQKAMIDSILYQEKVLSDEVAFELFEYAMQNLEKEDLKYEFNLFVSMQYFRTPRIHKNLSNSFDEIKKKSSDLSELNTKFSINLMALFFAQKMALNMTYKLNMSMELYINNSSVTFITGDTPVVNISNNKNIAEIYYPISPNVAIKLINGKNNMLITIDETKKNIVETFNAKLYENCVNEVYSCEEDILKDIR